MTKPVIVTRVGKGLALTYAEQDANFTNLQNATITVTDGTNSKALNLNDSLRFTAGTNVTLSVNSTTGAVTINSTSVATAPAGANTQLQFNNSGAFGASSSLTWDGSALSSPNLVASYSSGDEGGEIRFAVAQTTTTLNTSVTMDIYQDRLRIFETGGSNRGAYIDIGSAGAGVSTNLGARSSSDFGTINPTVYSFTSPGTTTVTSYTYDNTFINLATTSGNNYFFNFNFTPSAPTRWRFYVNATNSSTALLPQHAGSPMLLLGPTNGASSGKHILEIYYTPTATPTGWNGGATNNWVYYLITV